MADTAGKRALVTGGANGIGWAIARSLAGRGHRVLIADLDADAAKARAAELGEGHAALGVDLTDGAAAAALPARAAEMLGGLDIVVNNAGMTDTTGKTLVDLPAESFDRLIALNLSAVAAICGAAVDVLPSGGSIVNLASGAAYRPLALRGPYSATKTGVVELTHALAREFAPKGIRVSAVAPGYTRTPLLESLHAEGRVDLDAVARTIPLGRLVTPEDVAETVAFLADPEGRALNGECLRVDGGGQLGQVPAVDAPARGQANIGSLAVLGDDSLAGTLDAATNLEGAGALNGVVDARLMHAPRDPATALAMVRETAIRCAALGNRTADFALTLVVAEGRTALERAAAGAVGMLAETLALEWAAGGLRVNAVLWRPGSAEGLADLCRHLDGAGFVTGLVLRAGDH